MGRTNRDCGLAQGPAAGDQLKSGRHLIRRVAATRLRRLASRPRLRTPFTHDGQARQFLAQLDDPRRIVLITATEHITQHQLVVLVVANVEADRLAQDPMVGLPRALARRPYTPTYAHCRQAAETATMRRVMRAARSVEADQRLLTLILVGQPERRPPDRLPDQPAVAALELGERRPITTGRARRQHRVTHRTQPQHHDHPAIVRQMSRIAPAISASASTNPPTSVAATMKSASPARAARAPAKSGAAHVRRDNRGARIRRPKADVGHWDIAGEGVTLTSGRREGFRGWRRYRAAGATSRQSPRRSCQVSRRKRQEASAVVTARRAWRASERAAPLVRDARNHAKAGASPR
jgi:hypothetical protein